jgi:hypothetical protein
VLEELDNKCCTPVEVPEGEHRLQSQYCLWYSRREDFKEGVPVVFRFLLQFFF